MMRRIASLVVALSVGLGACVGGGLSHAERRWCSDPDNEQAMGEIAIELGVRAFRLGDEWGAIVPGRGILIEAYLDSPEGARACKEAHQKWDR